MRDAVWRNHLTFREEATGLFHIRILGKVKDVAGAAQGELGLAALAVHRVQKLRSCEEYGFCALRALMALAKGVVV